MPDQFASNFEHAALETDIARLAQEMQKRREMPESRSMGEREIFKQALLSVTAPQHTTQLPVSQAQGPLPNYAETASPEIKLEVEYLIDMAFHKGLVEAAKEARASDNPFVLDAFHDALVGKLYAELQARGLVK